MSIAVLVKLNAYELVFCATLQFCLGTRCFIECHRKYAHLVQLDNFRSERLCRDNVVDICRLLLRVRNSVSYSDPIFLFIFLFIYLFIYFWGAAIFINIYIYTGAGHIIRISSKSWFISLIPFKKWNLYNVYIHSTQTDVFQVFISLILMIISDN